MANPAYMKITGGIQGLISAGCSTHASIGNRYQSGHTDEIMVVCGRGWGFVYDGTRRV